MVPIARASGSPLDMIVDGAAYTVNTGVSTFIVFAVTWYAIESIVTETTGSSATVLISGLSALMSTVCHSCITICSWQVSLSPLQLPKHMPGSHALSAATAH